MGKPQFARSAIPARGTGDVFVENMHGVVVSAVNTGVPHAVVFDDIANDDIADLAAKIRFDPIFPHGANVDFVKIDGNTLFAHTSAASNTRRSAVERVPSPLLLLRTRWV